MDMTTKPRRREELSTVAKITQCATVPYCENRPANSFLRSGKIRHYTLKQNDRTNLVRANGSPNTYRFLRSSLHCLMGRLKVEGVVTGDIALENRYKCSVLIKKTCRKKSRRNPAFKTSTDNAHILHNRKQL